MRRRDFLYTAAAPLLEALGAGAIETGVVGDAPFTFAAAANVPVKAIGAIRQCFPNAQISVAARPSVADLYAREDSIDRVIVRITSVLSAITSPSIAVSKRPA